MKTTAEINIERLTKREREQLANVQEILSCHLATVRAIAGKYEGKWGAKLDRAMCELRDCVVSLGEVVG